MMTETSKFNNMQYMVRFPDGFSADQKYPIIIFLHGAGTRGSNIEALRGNSVFVETEKFESFPFIMYAPLCELDSWVDVWAELKEFVEHVVSLPYSDVERIYLTGNSMGGYGTWQLAMSMPETFAAIAPVCGGGMYWNAGRLVNTPVWAFHGEKDTCVFPEESKKMVDAINKRGGSAKLTLYPDLPHNSWTATYSDPKLFEWFLEHKNKNAQELKNEYNDAKKFG